MYTVALLNFEGPLDLLLQLIERSDMEITEVSLSDITSQYLGYIAKLPALGATELNQFLDLASRLIYLKSVALLPMTATQEIEEEISDLTEQLAQYQGYQVAANYLRKLISHNERSWQREAPFVLPSDKLPIPNINIGQLQSFFTRALANLPEAAVESTSYPQVSLNDMIDHLSIWLESQPGSSSLARFLAELNSRQEIIVAFMALLELIRLGGVDVTQTNLFDDIILLKPIRQELA